MKLRRFLSIHFACKNYLNLKKKLKIIILVRLKQRFSPSFFLYITTLIPPTWFLELENVRLKRAKLLGVENVTSDRINLEAYDLNELNLTETGIMVPPILASDLTVGFLLFI